MGIKKTGDWKKVEKLIGNLSKEMKDARDTSLKRFGMKAEALAKQHMSKQDLNWKPLSPVTVAGKVRAGLSENILVATSDYFRAITSWTDTGTGTAYAGVTRTVKNKDGKVIADIAKIHEYGSKNIPQRPLWRPVLAENLDWFPKSKSTPQVLFRKSLMKYL